MEPTTFSGGPRALPLTITFAGHASQLDFLSALDCEKLTHSSQTNCASVKIQLRGGSSLACKYVSDMKESPQAVMSSSKEFFNLYSTPSFDGDFTRGVICYDGGGWSAQSESRFQLLQEALTELQMQNWKAKINGSGGTPVALRRVSSPQEAVEVLESEVKKREGQKGGKKWAYFQHCQQQAPSGDVRTGVGSHPNNMFLSG
ncbi:hypothetical protein TrVE_jg10130 [Triparma verrucosa]|uniref:Uncharacterized protein n=2 Tax=Triparma TaxID=722752 RepID=A0A9W6ZQ88_9STRA|nr:hypothetical protein TrST_g3033 [Triparma strigata]GMH96431.1 hypothetical protein TrVE_jg10130 [Triparma verrucosa]